MKQMIKIRLKAYNNKILDQVVAGIVNAVIRTGATVYGPVPLPTIRRPYTVNRSPHVDKKSREQFVLRIHRRLLMIKPTQQTAEVLKNFALPAGVDLSIEILEEEAA